MPINEKQLNHLDGDGIVMRRWFVDAENIGKANVSTRLPNELAIELWQNVAFTNGPPLVKIEIIWAPEEAKKLASPGT